MGGYGSGTWKGHLQGQGISYIEDGLDRSPLVALKSFKQHLQLCLDVQQRTLEDLQTNLAEMMNQSMREVEHFQCNLQVAQMTSTPKATYKTHDTIFPSMASTIAPLPMTDNMSGKESEKNDRCDITAEEDSSGKLSKTLDETNEFQLKVPFECFSPLQSTDSSSISDHSLSRNAYVQQEMQNTENDDCKSTGSCVPSGLEDVHEDFKKQDAQTQNANDTEEIDSGSLRISDFAITENKSGMISEIPNAITLVDQVQDTLNITEILSPHRCDLFSCDIQKSEFALEKIMDNKKSYDRESLEEQAIPRVKAAEHVFKKNELKKHFLSKAHQMEVRKQQTGDANKALQRALNQLHSNAQLLMAENLHCREQITSLRREEHFLQLQLSKAEQDSEKYLEQMKVMIQKCEELLNERKQLQDERNHLSIEKQFLTREIGQLKNENKECVKELSLATTEKEELVQRLDYSKKTILSYTRETHELHCKLNEALMENHRLKTKSEKIGSQYLKETQRMV